MILFCKNTKKSIFIKYFFEFLYFIHEISSFYAKIKNKLSFCHNKRMNLAVIYELVCILHIYNIAGHSVACLKQSGQS